MSVEPIDLPIDLVVNAGGQSRRMGRAKALLPLPPDDTPLILHIIRRLAPLVGGKIVVVTNDAQVARTVLADAQRKVQKDIQQAGDIQVLPDGWPDGGALGGIATGLAACSGWTIVVACDMPLVDLAIFARLIDVARQQPTLDAIVPRVDGQAQPFHALWHRRALPTLETQLTANILAIQEALVRLNTAWMDERALGIMPDDRAFLNVNTLAEWEALLALWRGKLGGEIKTGR